MLDTHKMLRLCTILFLLPLLPLLAVACGKDEPVEGGGNGAQQEGNAAPSEGSGLDEAQGTGLEAGGVPQNGQDDVAPDAATQARIDAANAIEISTKDLVSAIEPEAYVAEIRAALAHAGTREDPIPVTTDFLGGWSFDETQSNPFPPHVRAIDGKYVIVKGFMLPDVDFEGITKFHLVRSLWGCCFGAPPRVNELIRIHTPGEEGLRYTYNTLEIVGKIEVKFELLDGLIEDLYRLSAESIVEGDFDDPLAPEGATAADLGDFLPDEMEF
jgi:hypothetical protein